MAVDTKYIVINAVGPYEFGGACVNNRYNILQVASQGGGVGIMEHMMPYIFPEIFKTPYEVQDGFKITGGKGQEVEGGRTIWANDAKAKSKLKVENEILDNIIKESIGALIELRLPWNIGQIKGDQALPKDQVKTLSGFCFKNQTADQSVTMLNVAGLNFNPSPRDSRHFKAIHQSYERTEEQEGWTEEEVKEYYTKLANNIFNQITKGDDKEKVVYFKIPGTDIFNPYHKVGTKSLEYKKYKDLVEDAMFDAIAEKCQSYIGPKITFQFDNPEKLKRLVADNQNISIKKCAQNVADFMKVAQDPVVSTASKQDDADKDTDQIVTLLNSDLFSSDIGESNIFQSTKLDDNYKGAKLDVSTKFTLTESSTAQAIFKCKDKAIIIHNFANDETIGGQPGITKHGEEIQTTGSVRAKAQEEGLFTKSTLFCSLSKFAEKTSSLGALKYDSRFKEQSTSKSIISEDVSFFGIDPTDSEGYIDWGRAGSKTEYLDQVKKVDVVTVAAKKYYKDQKNDIVDTVTDTVKRIREQLAASAHLARKNNQKGKQSHIVMGAFGCGAFNNDPKLIASIYRKFLLEKGGEFNRAFPEGTTFEFAIPLSKKEHDIVKSGLKDTTGYPNVRNHGAFEEHFFKQTKLTYDIEDEIKKAIVDTKKEKLASEAEEATRKAKENQIQSLQDDDIQNVESFMKWNKNSYEKLTEDPKNENNLNLFLNPKTVDGKEVFAGWGGRLQHENGSTFIITNVLEGGFADAIGLKQGDKIEIDSKHNDFAKLQGKMLEAALINKLRAGKLDGIKKIGKNINKENIGDIQKLYKENQSLFIDDKIESGKVQKDGKIKEFLENHLNKLIQAYLGDANKENCKKLEDFLSPLETPTAIGKDNKEIPREDIHSIRDAEMEAEDSEATYLESRNVVKLINYFTNDRKMKYSQLASSDGELIVDLSNDNPYEAIKNFKKAISCITNEKQDKRVFILADGNFFSAICQQKEKGSWVTKFYDVRGKEAEKIAENLSVEINKSGFIKHDGTCGIGAACMAVNFFNNDGKLVNEAGKNHKEVWGGILKLKEDYPSTTPASPTIPDEPVLNLNFC